MFILCYVNKENLPPLTSSSDELLYQPTSTHFISAMVVFTHLLFSLRLSCTLVLPTATSYNPMAILWQCYMAVLYAFNWWVELKNKHVNFPCSYKISLKATIQYTYIYKVIFSLCLSTPPWVSVHSHSLPIRNQRRTFRAKRASPETISLPNTIGVGR